MKKVDTLVLIGRFNPLTDAHEMLIKRAVEMCHELIILVGSYNQPRTFKNPFTYPERAMMIQNVLDDMDTGKTRVHVEPLEDSLYNDQAWAKRVQGIISKYRILGGTVGIIGHKKDGSSFYLDMFPQWELIEVERLADIDATGIRDKYFRQDPDMKSIKSSVPVSTYNLLKGWLDTPEYNQIIAERTFIEAYKKQFSMLPYPPIFVTADAVVVCSGHILMIKRRAEPGKGLWALPGGFVNANTDRSCQDAAIRELREETGIKVPVPVLVGSIVNSRVFDAIGRSDRGRTITHAIHIELPMGELPKVKGLDDAEKAKWVPIYEITRNKCFDDHFEIICEFLKI